MSDRADAIDGARAISPFLLGVVPFGLVYGVTAIDRGLDPTLVAAMSAIVFAGAAQLAAVDLIAKGSPAVVVLATILVVNLRYPMYAASIAPHFRAFTTRSRAICAYLMTDQAYAVALTEYREQDTSPDRRLWYYVGAAFTLWIAWQLSTITGILVGARVPPGLSLEFAIPLTFLALLVPNVTDRASALAALVGGVGTVLGANLPYDVSLVAAALAGVVVATILDDALATDATDGSAEEEA
ncbi:AzlC family ABC transporter permease [Halorubellus sp. JP-L1]|uniref:AzlC family ABC transporter permease n=1 Tax=Halorubellus sp. JP-L1 TaxID=2715753 RepID=UPI00140812FE|nr:AzlC family ABC transporter permease [Halorubellus sp. JP-L1]